MAPPDPARVVDLFDALADLPAEEAARRLEVEHGADPELREEVARLLAGDRRAGADFLRPRPGLLGDAIGEREAAAAGDAPGPALRTSARVGRFALLRQLGEGGMGVVFAAYDEALDRRVAIKVLRRGGAAPERLVREAQALAKLSHPNVVPVYEVGEHEGRVFVAMELVDGPTLRGFLADATRPLDEVLRVLVDAGAGLAAAHDAGLVHRDFKPDNVLVGKDGRARVVDFGIAGLAGPAGPLGEPGELDADRPIAASPSALSSSLTLTGALLGTPSFMSPEQLRGERATPASDQFGFCVAAWKAVYREAPFEGESLLELARNVCAGALRPAPEAPRDRAWLAPILARGLSLAPSDRWPSMAALLEAIRARLPAHPDLDLRVTRPARRTVGAVFLALAAAIGGVVLARGGEENLRSAWDLVALAAVLVVAAGVTVALLWRRLSRNLAGRRFVYIFLGGIGLLFLHRLVGARLGVTVRQMLVLDTLNLAATFALCAPLVERGFGVIAAIGLAAAAGAALQPAYAVQVFALYTLLASGLTVALLGRLGGEK